YIAIYNAEDDAFDIVGSPTRDASQITTGTLPDARLSDNVPLKNAPNVFVGGDGTYANARIKIEASGIPTLGFRDTSGPGTDEGITVFRQQNNQFSVRSRNDADDDGAILWHGTRSGSSWSEFEVNATLLDFNGNADISGTLAVGGTI